jgi:hypothetical protein
MSNGPNRSAGLVETMRTADGLPLAAYGSRLTAYGSDGMRFASIRTC